MKIFITLSLLIFSAQSYAGQESGKVYDLIVRASDGLVYFKLAGGEHINKPDCATFDYWMIRDENSNAGKQQLSMLLAAYASQKTIKVIGMGSCNRWGDGEDVKNIILP